MNINPNNNEDNLKWFEWTDKKLKEFFEKYPDQRECCVNYDLFAEFCTGELK